MSTLSPIAMSIWSWLGVRTPGQRRGNRGGSAIARRAKTKLRCEELEQRVLLDAEHDALLALVKYEAVTDTLVQNGSWSDPNTWDNGVPTAGANVLIPEGMNVLFDASSTPILRTIRVDGTMQFATNINTDLVVDTVVVTPTGTLLMGTQDNPVPQGITAKIDITPWDGNNIDTTWDPRQLSRGLISHGSVSMYGAQTTSDEALAGPAMAGQTVLHLAETPTNWNVGDYLVVTGTNPNANYDEVMTIASIAGSDVTLSTRLRYSHDTRVAPEGQSIYVTDLTRNVMVESTDPSTIQHRGHVMFMHNPDVNVDYVGFYNLGRTDKSQPIDDPVLDPIDGHLISGGTNPRGRYAVHFHRTGIDASVPPGVVKGSVVVNSPGWGFVNHSSNVNIDDNVTYNVFGAGFVSEAGDEIGYFRNNLAIRSTGTNEGIEQRKDVQDFGQLGDGYWFQGGGVHVQNNIAVGQHHAGFVFFTQGLVQAGLGTDMFLAANLPDPAWANGQTYLPVANVPILDFTGNSTYASGFGFQSYKNLLNVNAAGDTRRSLLADFTGWNMKTTRGANIPYTNRATLDNVRLYGSGGHGTAITRNDATRNITYLNDTLTGWEVGINAPVQGTTMIVGGTFNDVRDIFITTATNNDRLVNIYGNVQFGTLATATMPHYDVYLTPNYNPKYEDITTFFDRDRILINTPTHNNNGQAQQLFYLQQLKDAVPFPSGQVPSYFPPELVDLTNQQLFDQFGLALGGLPAPDDATTATGIWGAVGTPYATTAYVPILTLASAKYSPVLTNYQLKYKINGGSTITDPQREQLHAGWNVITRMIGGHVRTFLVFGGDKPAA
jgi:hypothetical protein